MKFFKENFKELAVFSLIILISAFLRFYKMDQYMNFLGDEGRDALVIKRLLVQGDIPFIGSPTSVGNIYLGPMYYYMMAIPMAIFWLNPVAATGMVALIGTLTVGLVYFLTRKWFGIVPAIIASTLYSLSPVNIIYSKTSWNPTPLPFFSLLALLGLYLARTRNNFLWFILTGFALGCAVQMHYLALILLPVFGILWINELIHYFRNKRKNFTLGTIGAITTFFILLFPLLLFDLKHNFMNYRAFVSLFQSSDAVGFNPLTSLGRIGGIYSYNLIGRYIAGSNALVYMLLSVLIILPLVYAAYKIVRKEKTEWGYLVLGVWLILGLIGMSFYKSEIYDHYLGFLNPVPFILFGSLAGFKGIKGIFSKIILSFVVLFAILLGVINIQNSPLGKNPNNQLKHTQDIARFIISKTEGKQYNFALISERNYDSAYRFYLGEYGDKLIPTYDKVTDQLIVVCEDKECDPVRNDRYEIQSFGMSKVDWVQDFEGVKVFKLIANPEGKPQ